MFNRALVGAAFTVVTDARTCGAGFCVTRDDCLTCDTVKLYRGDGTSPRDIMNAQIRARFRRASGG